jgi:hypothetical protein
MELHCAQSLEVEGRNQGAYGKEQESVAISGWIHENMVVVSWVADMFVAASLL